MKTIYTDILHANANQRFQLAEEELIKGTEGNAYATCMNCKIAMRQYLTAYLIDHGIDPGEYQTIHLLLEKCKKIDHGFDNLDMSAIDCRYERLNEDYCTDSTHLSDCVDTVRSIKLQVSR